jgi:hypothetical protein
MGKPVVLILCVLALAVTLYRGAVWAFVSVYLPTLLLLAVTPQIALPSIPDMDARSGVIYGILGGLVLKGGEALPFRFGFADLLILLLALSAIITGAITEQWWTGVNVLGDQFLNFVVPYFLARAMFHYPEARRRALWTCVAIMGLLVMLAAIEMRLYPFFVSRLMHKFGLYAGSNDMIMMRFGFFRTQLTLCHPIDVGNVGLLVAGMIALCASTTAVRLRNVFAQAGIAAALVVSLSSMSWSSYAALFAGVALFVGMWLAPLVARLLPAIVVGMIVGGFVMAHHLNNMQLGEREDVGQTISDSLQVRALIMQNAWPFASTSGLFGWGKTIRHSELNLDSVDNGYLLFTMSKGWVYLGLFLMLPLWLAVRVSKVYGRTRLPQHRFPIAAATAAVIGITVAVFTVWFGFVYSYMWLIMLAMTHSAIDTLLYGPPPQPMLTGAEAPPVVARRRRVVISRPTPAALPAAGRPAPAPASMAAPRGFSR